MLIYKTLLPFFLLPSFPSIHTYTHSHALNLINSELLCMTVLCIYNAQSTAETNRQIHPLPYLVRRIPPFDVS